MELQKYHGVVNQMPQILPHQLPPLPLLPQHIITSGTRKDCIRLRGLPYEAQVEHILEFLGEFAKNIVFQGVHMVYSSQVRILFISFSRFIFVVSLVILTQLLLWLTYSFEIFFK